MKKVGEGLKKMGMGEVEGSLERLEEVKRGWKKLRGVGRS